MPGEGIAACFKLKVRCFNCRSDTVHRLEVPAVEDAPTDVEELMGSEFLSGQKFKCKVCEMPIGVVVACVELKDQVYA